MAYVKFLSMDYVVNTESTIERTDTLRPDGEFSESSRDGGPI